MAKILVVDDDEGVMHMLKTLLEFEGFTVLAAHNGVCAWNILMDNPDFDLLICDVVMPELDGHKAVEGIRELERGMGVGPEKAAKIVMTSALGDMKSVMKAYGNFCDAYLVKPIRKDALLAELERLKLIDGPTARHGEKH